MNRTTLAALFTPFLLLASPGLASASPPEQCYFGKKGGFILTFYPRIHQHGPLFNYGPYYGYPPFAPYGPWNAYLQYNPWYFGLPNQGGGGGHGHGHGDLAGHGPLCGSLGCGGLGCHSLWGAGGWFGGCSTCGHGGLFTGFGGWGHGLGSGGCGPAGCIATPISGNGISASLAFNPETTDPLSRYSGAGNAADFAGFYSGLPALDPNVVLAGGLGK